VRVIAAAPGLLLFVYGSLKRGQPNHHELGPGRFVAEVSTVPQFALRVMAGYPLLVAGAQSIRGELFTLPVPHLASLDAFEGEAYQRWEIDLLDGGCATAYMARDPNVGEAFSGDEWPYPV
jgi:gamma-glutamylcyclotransferase (GGCT)/AIG2-like uncharacterized protein YtfP